MAGVQLTKNVRLPVAASRCRNFFLRFASSKSDENDKHFAVFDIFGKIKSAIFDIIAEKHFAIFDISYVTRISQIPQILLADGERLPQAENLRNLCNLCDPQKYLL